MKRRSLFIGAVLVMVFALVLSACATGGEEAPTVEVPEVEVTEPVVEPEVTEAVEPEVTEPPAEETEPPAEETEAVTPEAEATEPAETEEPTTGMSDYWTPELKQAIAAAIDRETLVDRVFEGRNTPAYHMVPPGYPFATEPFLDRYGTRDLDMAIQLLQEAGYSEDNPFVFELWYPPEHYGTTTADVMQVLKEQLEETGMITVNLQSQNWAEYVDSFVAGESFPMFILGWFPDFADPDNWLTPFGSCTSSPDQGVFYCDEELDNLLQSAAAATDEAERETLYQQIGDYWAENVPTLPLFWEEEFVVVRDGVEGVTIGPPFEFNYHVLSFGEGAQPASGSTDTIIIGTTDEVNSLDSADAYATHDWEVIKNTGVSLMSYEPGTANLVPGAAAAPPEVSEDGLTYTYTLRDDLMFADGTPVTAEDYVRSWNRLNTLEGQVSGLVQAYVADVQAVDERTVAYTLTDTYAFFPILSATAPFVPMPPDVFTEEELVQFPETLGGIGAYQMVSHTPGEQMVLEVNPNYFGEAPAIQQVIIRYFADPTTMANAVETGEIDVAWRVLGPVEAARLEAEGEGLTVQTVDAPALRYLVLNHNFAGER